MSGAILVGATLNGCNFSRVDLSGRDLSGFDLTNVNLTSANLNNANLTNANLTNANLTNVTLINATLTRAILTGATIDGATLPGANFTGVNLTGRNLSTFNLINVNFTNANLSDTTFKSRKFVPSNFTNAILAGSSICRFERITPGIAISPNGRTATSTAFLKRHSAVASIGCSAGTLSWNIHINGLYVIFGIWNSNDTPSENAYRNPNSICVENGYLWRAGSSNLLPSIQLSSADMIRVTVDATERTMTITNTTKYWTQRIIDLPAPNPGYYPLVIIDRSEATIEF